MSEARAPGSQPPPSSAARCPGCGKTLDALRAGHVAILDGRFQYFCDASCKTAFLSGRAGGSQDLVATAEPPPARSGERAVASRERVPEPAEALAGDESAGLAPPPGAAAPPPAPAQQADEPPPVTLRSPATNEDAAPVPAPAAQAARPAREAPLVEGAAARGLGQRWTAIAGAMAGVAAPCLALLGVGVGARAGLAGVAALALAARAAVRERHPADSSPLLRVVPVVAALAAGTWGIAVGDARAPAAVSFAALAAASALVVELVMDRAREGLRNAHQSIAKALDVEVRLVRGSETLVVSAAEARPGEQVVVDAGQTVGVDGVVVAGEATVVPFLGSPMETTKSEGDAIVAGARVVSGKLRINTTWSGADRAWMKLVSSPAMRVDVTSPLVRFSRLLLERGAIVAAALCAVAAWIGSVGWIEVAIVASAAVVAVSGGSVAAIVGLAHARGQLEALGHGVVYKDPAAFDRAGHAEIAVLCSRGTVLMGEPEIVALEPMGTLDEARLLALAAGAETASTHPLAAAILRAARIRNVRPDNVRSAVVHAGLGLTALTSAGERLVVGSRALLLQEKVSVAVADGRVSELEAQGRSVLLVAVGGRLAGLIALQDGLRPGARAAVQRLHDARIEPVLLSGEARDTCETIGRALDVDHIRPEVLPADRGAEVKALREGGRVVAVLGHPAGDDGALGAADVSIAMSAAGAAPGEWGIVLASDDVRDGAFALSVAHDTRRKACAALVAGLVPGAVAVLAIAFGIAPPIFAPLAGVLGALLALSRCAAA